MKQVGDFCQPLAEINKGTIALLQRGGTHHDFQTACCFDEKSSSGDGYNPLPVYIQGR